MENRAHALAAGLFTVIFAVALVLIAYWLKGAGTAEKPYLLISVTSVSGLNPQAAVRYRGLEVGRVETMQFAPNDPHKIMVKISVEENTPVTDKTYGQLRFQGLTGLAYIQLDDAGTVGKPLPTSPQNPAQLPLRPSPLTELTANAPQLIERLNGIVDRVSLLLDDENIARVHRTLANVETASARFAKLESKLEPTFDEFPAIAKETRQTMQQANKLIADLDTLTNDLNKRVGVLDRMATNVDKIGVTADKLGHAGDSVSKEILNSSLPKLNRLLDDLSQTSHNLDRLLTELEQRPQSLIFGKKRPRPGPGEQGFTPAKP